MGFSEINLFATVAVAILVTVTLGAYLLGVRRKEFYGAVVGIGLILVAASVIKRNNRYCPEPLDSGQLINLASTKSCVVTNGLIQCDDEVVGEFDCDSGEISIRGVVYSREVVDGAIVYRSHANRDVVYEWLPY